MKTVKTTAARVATTGVLSLSLLIAAAGLYVFAGERHSLFGEFLSVGDVCQRWGDGPLDVAAFRSAEDDEPVRAAMACSLLKNQDDHVGMHVSEIGSLFGDSTGYFVSEGQPAYLIEIAKTKAEDSWQIVFLHNRDGKVTEIVVHKNCCEELPSSSTLD